MNDGVDIADLVSIDPRIGQYVSNGLYDFSSQVSLRLYTAAFLQHKYSLRVDLSDDNLCPAIPNRLLYVRYLHDLVECCGVDKPVCGVDIGTGHVAIFPLLACAENPNWTFIGTEINERSLEHAKVTVAANGLGGKITLVKSDGSVVPPGILSKDRQYFTMCNPPFYGSEEEMLERSRLKEDKRSAPVAVREELITDGGEVGFVKKMIEESTQYKHVRWFTSMLGKLDSVPVIVDHLRENGIGNFALHELVPGKTWVSTRRWVVGWSFHPQRPTNALCLCQSSKLKKFNPPHPQVVLPVSATQERVLGLVKKLGFVTSTHCVRLELKGDVWSRSYRRKPNREFDADEALTVEISVGDSVVVYWRSGHHYKTFESFVGWLKKNL